MKFQGAFWGPATVGNEKFYLLKPYTFMNLSGLSVLEAVKYRNIEPENILVIFDDAALPFGRLRLREKGSAGGQKGMVSILGALRTLEVPRLRVGIGAPEPGVAMPDWVLARMSKEQKSLFGEIEAAVCEGVTIWLEQGMQKAMAFVNSFRLEAEHK